MPKRLSRDINLLIDVRSRDSFELEHSSPGFRMLDRLSIGGNRWISEETGELDVLESDAPWVADAIAQPERTPDGSQVIALPYLVLLKLNGSRGIDIGDLTKMLGLADEVVRDRVREIVLRFQPEDIDDLESLIALGDLEFGAARAAHE